MIGVVLAAVVRALLTYLQVFALETNSSSLCSLLFRSVRLKLAICIPALLLALWLV